MTHLQIPITSSLDYHLRRVVMPNVHRNERQWDEFAKGQGHPTLKSLLYDLYVVKSCTLREVGQALGLNKDRVAQLLEQNGMPRRSRGGVR
jgi:hypothetical protein